MEPHGVIGIQGVFIEIAVEKEIVGDALDIVQLGIYIVLDIFEHETVELIGFALEQPLVDYKIDNCT